MFSKIPTELIDYIYTFYNNNKILYNLVLDNLHNYFKYKKVLKKLKSYSIYDKNKNFINFQIDAILQTY